MLKVLVCLCIIGYPLLWNLSSIVVSRQLADFVFPSFVVVVVWVKGTFLQCSVSSNWNWSLDLTLYVKSRHCVILWMGLITMDLVLLKSLSHLSSPRLHSYWLFLISFWESQRHHRCTVVQNRTHCAFHISVNGLCKYVAWRIPGWFGVSATPYVIIHLVLFNTYLLAHNHIIIIVLVKGFSPSNRSLSLACIGNSSIL